jgi:hypothetical protein
MQFRRTCRERDARAFVQAKYEYEVVGVDRGCWGVPTKSLKAPVERLSYRLRPSGVD